MKRIFINDNYLRKDDIDFEVVRVKALLVNSKGELLLAHNNNTYQLIGGHVEVDGILIPLFAQKVCKGPVGLLRYACDPSPLAAGPLQTSKINCRLAQGE